MHRATISSELSVLAKKQNEEISAYTALIATRGAGATPGKTALDHYAATLKSMATTVRDKDLSHVPGGHPAQMVNMYADLGGLNQLAGKRIGDPVTPADVFAVPALPKPGTREYITLASIYGWYDRGGILPPGLTLAYNGTGRNEVVTPVPPGGVIGPGGMSPGEMQIINRLDRLISMSASAPARPEHRRDRQLERLLWLRSLINYRKLKRNCFPAAVRSRVRRKDLPAPDVR